MKFKKALPVILLLICPSLLAQPARRIAILPANDKYQELENHVADSLTGKLAGNERDHHH